MVFLTLACPNHRVRIALVRDGDTVIVYPMDRLARDLDDLRRAVQTLTGKGVRVEFVKEQLTFTGEDNPMALPLSAMGAFAEFERARILERQREGIAAVKQRGAYTGRKPAPATDAGPATAPSPSSPYGPAQSPAAPVPGHVPPPHPHPAIDGRMGVER